MEINSINSAAPPSGARPAADSIPALSAPASGTQPVMANAVKATGPAEKTVTGKKATDRQPSGENTGTGKTVPPTDMAQIKASLDTLSRASSLQFSIDEELGRVVVKVLDPETREVLKQFPSEDALVLARSLHGGNGSLHRAEA